MRLRIWASMFSEGTLIFWNSLRFLPEVEPAGYPANIWLGPEERSYIKNLQHFSRNIPGDASMCSVSAPSGVRAYCLAGAQSMGLYVHHYESHSTTIGPLNLGGVVPRAGTLVWIRPDTGDVIQQQNVPAGLQHIVVPRFTVDIAAYLNAN